MDTRARVIALAECQTAFDLAIILDSSMSIGEENFDFTLEFLATLTSNLNVGFGDNQIRVRHPLFLNCTCTRAHVHVCNYFFTGGHDVIQHGRSSGVDLVRLTNVQQLATCKSHSERVVHRNADEHARRSPDRTATNLQQCRRQVGRKSTHIKHMISSIYIRSRVAGLSCKTSLCF